LGAALSMQNESKKEHKDGERLSLLNVSDSIGLKYFPVTLGASYAKTFEILLVAGASEPMRYIEFTLSGS
jgi:hypothetical protein